MAKEVKGSGKTLDLLLENSIALQKTLTDLATDLKTLNNKLSSLIGLFESASKTIRERPAGAGAGAPIEVLDKINALSKQNKTIAKGLLLLERAIREKEEKAAPVPSVRPLPEI